MARDRPSPYDEGGGVFIVSRGPVPRDLHRQVMFLGLLLKTVFFTVARGPVPRDRWSARTLARACPSPYGEGG